jgi:hypothetical protein
MASGLLNGKLGDRTIVTVGRHTEDGHFIVSFKPLVPAQHLESEAAGQQAAQELLGQFLRAACAEVR